MGRFDKFFKAVQNVADPKIEEGDETKLAENPRNWLSDKVNTILPESVQLPLQTVAEEKQHLIDLPQNMAGATMGGIRTGTGVRVIPTTQQLLEEAAAAKPPVQLKATEVSKRFQELFGQEAAKRKDLVKKGLDTIGGYDSFKQEMLNKIRNGEIK